MEQDTTFDVQEKTQTVTKYQYSERISSRRKALFPSLTDDNSDLGPMSPLSDTNSSPSDCVGDSEELKSFKDYFSSFRSNVNNYMMYDRKSNKGSDLKHNVHIEESVDKCASPINQSSPKVLNTNIQDTPLKESPTKNLKTPHDTSNSNSVKVPKLIRKHNGDFLHDIETGKHNFSPTNSPCCKLQKLDNNVSKLSKVRTALFPDISLSTQSFYPKSNEKKVRSSHKNSNCQNKSVRNKSAPMYLCNRRPSNRNRYGSINAGVRHKIRKPKQKLAINLRAKKAAMTVEQCAQLLEYIKEMNNIMTNSAPKLINVLRNKEITVGEECLTENVESTNVEESSTEVVSKRIFKSAPVGRSVIVCNGNVTIEVPKNSRNDLDNREKNKIVFDMLDFANDNEDDLIVSSLDKIISTLDEEQNVFPVNNSTSEETVSLPCNKIILKASNTINESDNSILFHHPQDHSKYTNCKERKRKLENKENESAELLLSPTSQMCDMTSGLAINSPKRAKLNITSLIDTNSLDTSVKNVNIFNKISSTSAMDKQKLFPIFYTSHSLQNKETKANNTDNNKTGAFNKKWKNLPEGQMLLDAGQKRFGFTQCSECEIVYHMGDPSEEIMHMNYHNAKDILSFKGWKNENVVGSLIDARIVKVSPGDSKIWWKKVKELALVINRDLGYYEMEFDINNSVVLLYIKNKLIVGCIIAEPKAEAFKMLSCFEGIDVCSQESYPIKCGISRIWVSQTHRRQGIGTAMLECLRTNFSYGYVLRCEDMALSSPSELGKYFAKKYFQTENFLIYTS